MTPPIPSAPAGSTIAIVAPSGPADPVALAAGSALLESWGYVVRPPRSGRTPHLSWLSDTDAARAAEFAAAWLDPDVDVVWTARGGYGAQRMIDLLDWSALARRRPLLVGYSDTTALHQTVGVRVGSPTLHADGVTGLAAAPDGVQAALRLSLCGRPPVLEGTRGSGTPVTGPLTGGNLTMLASSVGTGDLAPAADRIVLLEDVGEHLYRLDRCLTQLLRTGWFDGVAGVGLGSFSGCGEYADVIALCADRLAGLGAPIVHGLPIGHQDDNYPVFLGVTGHLDPVAGTLAYDG